MDAGDHLGLGQHEEVVVALEVAATATTLAVRMVGRQRRALVAGGDVAGFGRELQAIEAVLEALAAVVGLVELMLLHHRAHGAVEHEDPRGHRIEQLLDAGGVLPGQEAHPRLCSVALPPSLWAIRVMTSKCGGRFSLAATSQTRTSKPAFSASFRSSFSLNPRFTWP